MKYLVMRDNNNIFESHLGGFMSLLGCFSFTIFLGSADPCLKNFIEYGYIQKTIIVLRRLLRLPRLHFVVIEFKEACNETSMLS